VVAAGVAGLSFNLTDVYGNNIDTSAFGAYTAGGTIARIFTLGTPWSEVDLAYLKFTQSKDVMSICCVNQVTRVEYPPQDLSASRTRAGRLPRWCRRRASRRRRARRRLRHRAPATSPISSRSPR
jgi:hypothetical protein